MMKAKFFLLASLAAAAFVASSDEALGQICTDGLNCPRVKIGRYQNPYVRGAKMILSGGHPHPVYAHSRNGINATRTHRWNQEQAMQRSWHAGHYYPKYGQPLALVVPPTASFQSVYSWGVGNTKSVPIYHQYGRPYPGEAAGAHQGMYQPTPAQPWNTQQFGVYYSRAPW